MTTNQYQGESRELRFENVELRSTLKSVASIVTSCVLKEVQIQCCLGCSLGSFIRQAISIRESWMSEKEGNKRKKKKQVKEQWEKPKQEATPEQIKIMIGLAVKAAIKATVKNHTFQVNGKNLLQSKKGIIGLDLIRAHAKLYMIDWTDKFKERLKKIQENAAKCHEELQIEEEYAVDDVSGAFLDPKMVKKARADEIEYVRDMKLYTKVPIGECLARTGKQPIAVRWIDVNKGDDENPLLRSRYVGKEFNDGPMDGLFAATPPAESLRAIVS